ncbi:ACTR5 [Lepeophtheirus salmonis]|uniref:ACTR5 n=1 Tax=Lepeophtheirus salmonis TaxID=72036 RepID=A0A7R8CJG1_LEPSM|nr:ACTR5 [Lepeophtheirus salmonis]CAF2838455.1 ACTR5 [Lepeophtheirus salmonis]
MDFVEKDPTVYPLNELKMIPDKFHDYPPPPNSAIIIDNGSYNCRMGWSTSPEPELIYRNVVARSRKEKSKEAELQIGNDISSGETLRGGTLKSPFDRNVVTQFQTQEMLLDYGFAHLGINSQGSVPHPVVISHPIMNPNLSQNLMNELLFECYSVPKVAYFVDALTSYHQNKDLAQDALIVSLSHHTMHFIPWISGKIAGHGVRRINLGGAQIINFLHRTLQLKYPGHLNNITLSRAEEIFHNHAYVSSEYLSDLKLWSGEGEYYSKNVHKIQLPYVPIPKPPPPDPEILNQRRQVIAKRLIEINAQRAKIAKNKTATRKMRTVRNCWTPAAPSPKTRRGDMCETEKPELDAWLGDIKQKSYNFRKEILDKRGARQLRKQQLAKRRTAASQERMRMISQLAKSSKKDDNFGMRDEDWDVYKKINKDIGDSDSDEEQEKLVEYEKVLREHDPHFGIPEEQEIPTDSLEWYQLHLSTERIRAPEILFQPSIIGHEQGGISETLEFILSKFDPELQGKLVNNIFVTGSLALLPGIKERLENDIMAMRPFQSKFNVSVAKCPSLDSWYGARKMVTGGESEDLGIYMTKLEYHEKGIDYFKEHSLSNYLVQRPPPQADEKNDEAMTARDQ